MKLASAREELATIVASATASDTGVVDHIPDSVAPPVVFVAWSDPWLQKATFCDWQAAMELVLVSQRIEPGGHTETLENMVESIVIAIKQSSAFVVVDVTAPYPLQVGGVNYLAASINITHDLEET